MLVFCFFFAFSPVVLLVLGWLLSLLLGCSFESYVCADLSLWAYFRISLIYLGTVGYIFTIPAGFVFAAFGVIIANLPRRWIINGINAMILLPVMLVCISAMVGLLRPLMWG